MRMLGRCIAMVFLSALAVSPAFAKQGDQTTEGVISARTAASLTVGGVAFSLTSSTECQQLSVQIDCATLAVGDSVEIKWRDAHVVREVERRTTSVTPTPNPTPSSSPSPTPSPGVTPSPGATPQPSATARPSQTPDDHGGRNTDGGKDSKARLTSEGELSLSVGKAEYIGKRRDSRFKVAVYVAQGTTPSFQNIEEAQAAELSAILSTDGVDYAKCSLLPDDSISSKSINGVRMPAFEFKLDIRKKKSNLRSKKGTCDIDLATEGVQEGIPSVHQNDAIRINDPIAGDFLNGTF